MILFSDQQQTADPVLIEPLSALPLEEPTAADIQMSETIPEFQAQTDETLKPVTAV